MVILTLEYSYEDKMITSKRGFFGLLTERNSFLARQSKSESTLKKPSDFYYLEYETRCSLMYICKQLRFV